MEFFKTILNKDSMFMGLLSMILTSAVVSALVSSITNIRISNKKNSLKYITEDRKTWRQYLRKECPKLISLNEREEKKNIVNILELNLNPYDIKDINILILARAISEDLDKEVYLIKNSAVNIFNIIKLERNKTILLDNKYYDKIETNNFEREFINRVSKLLKADWDRSKKEANSLMFFEIIKFVTFTNLFKCIFKWWERFKVKKMMYIINEKNEKSKSVYFEVNIKCK